MATMVLEDVAWETGEADVPTFSVAGGEMESRPPSIFPESEPWFTAPADSVGIDQRLVLAVSDRQRVRIGSLDVHFTRRADHLQDVSMYGVDRSGSLRVRISLHSSMSRLDVAIHFDPALRVEATELLTVVDWLRSIAEGESLELWSESEPTPLAASPTRALGGLTFPRGYVETVRLLSRIQRQIGLPVAVPDRLSGNEIQAAERVLALLAGETVRARWFGATVVVDEARRQIFETPGPGGIRFEIADDEASLDRIRPGYRFPVLRTFMQARVTSITEFRDLWAVHLEPGAEIPDVITTRLHLGDIDMCRGSWVADRGGLIVARGDTPDEVVRRLRDTNERGAIWRVPATRQEAESVWA